jgi:DNA-binding NarL/FixJ family response regulator
MAVRLVLADDHPIVLDGLRYLLTQEEGFAVMEAVADGQEALRAVREHRPDLLVLDLKMPTMDGLAVLRALSAENLPTRVVILTAALNERDVLEAMRLGACGLLLKEAAPELLVRCLRTVQAGGQWLERDTVANALAVLMRREAGMQRVAAALTPREVEIVRLVAAGRRNKEIARQLDITEGVVKNYLHDIYQKAGVEHRTALALYARHHGLI